jgi:hypothetical protein
MPELSDIVVYIEALEPRRRSRVTTADLAVPPSPTLLESSLATFVLTV